MADTADDFPCRVPFKVFLRPDGDAEQRLHAACEQAADARIECERQPSRNARYVCLRLTLTATSAEQLDAVKRAIAAEDAVLLAL